MAEAKIRLAVEGGAVVTSEMGLVDRVLEKLGLTGRATGDQLAALQGRATSAASGLQALTVQVGSLDSVAQRATSSFSGLAKGLILGAAAGVSIDALTSKIGSTIEAMGNLKTVSEKTGASVENLSKLNGIARQAGSDIDSVAGSLVKLSKGLAGADDETKGAGAALSYLGIAAKDSNGNLRDSSEVYTDIAKKLDGYKDGTGKTAIAIALFGKAGAEQLAVMKLLAQSGEQSIKVTTEQAEAARNYTRDLVKLDIQKNEVFKTLAMALVPTMGDFVKVLLDASKKTNVLNAEAKSLAKDHTIEDWADGAAIGLARLIDVIKTLPGMFAAVKGSASAVIADIGLVGKTALMLNPVSLAKNIAQGQNPFDSIKVLLADRNKTLADANTAYDKLWNAEGNATEKAMQSRITARRAERDFYQNADAKDLRGRAADRASAAAKEKAKEDLTYNTSKEGKEARAKAVKELVDEDAKLLDSTQKGLAALQAEIELDAKLTPVQKHIAEQYAEISKGKVAYKLETLLAVDAINQEKLAAEDFIRIRDAGRKATEESNKERQKEIDAVLKATTALEDQIRVQQDHNDGIGQTKEAIAALTAQRELDKASTLEASAIKALDRDLDYQKYDAVMAQVGAMRELAGLKAEGGALQTVQDEAKKSDAAWKHTSGSITNYLVGAFEQSSKKGQSIFVQMRDNVENLFKRMALNFVINGTVNAAGQALGISGASGGTSALGLASNASSAYSLYNNASSAYTVGGQVFGGNMSVANGAGTIYGNATNTGIDGLLSTNGAYGTAAGAGGVSAYTGAVAATDGIAGGATIFAAESAPLAGGAVAGEGALAAAGPYGWIALALIAAYFAFKGDDKPSSSTGESSINFASDGKQTADISGSEAQFATFKNGAYDNVVKGLAGDYQRSAKALGITAKETNFGFGGNNGEGGDGKNIAVAGGVIGGPSYQSGEVKDTPENLKLLASRAVLSALEGSELPKYLKGVFDGIDPGKLDQGQVSAVLERAQALKSFNDQLLKMPFAGLAEYSFAATQGLIAAAGGLDKLSGGLADYYNNYYIEAEKTTATSKQISDALAAVNIEMPKTRDGFRAEMDARIKLGDAGAPAVAALLSVQGAFASIVPAAVDAATATAQAADSLAQAAAQMKSQVSSLAGDFLNSADLRQFRAGEIQQTLAGGGVNLSIEQILNASRNDALALFNSYAQNSPEQKAIADAGKAFVDLTAAQQQAQQSYSSGGGGGDAGASAASSIANAWQQITDSMFDAVAKIRGDLAGVGADGFAVAQSKLAIATAQARADNQDAAKALPQLASAMLALAGTNVATRLDLQRLQATTANSLSETGSILAARHGTAVPSFDVGTDYVPRDMLAMIHEGERITPKAFNPVIGNGGGQDNAALQAEVRALRQELANALAAIEANTRAGAMSGAKVARTLERVAPQGDAVHTRVIA